MKEKIEAIYKEFQQDLIPIHSSSDIESLKVKYLGKKGPIQNLMKELKEVSAEERPTAGKWINDLKEQIALRLDTFLQELIQKEEEKRLIEEKIDVTLPGRRRFSGRKHVLTQGLDEVIDILIGMGFSVQYGPDIETDYYNFEALNFPPDHPARDMQDTFYIAPKYLLRTHTTNTQVRIMESERPPIRIITPGKAYRNEAVTARSHVFFHQLDAFYVDKGVTFADLMATLDEFLRKLFQTSVETRYRPSYFPFVEPGIEVDVSCLSCKGEGCHLCKHSGWLEVAGAGMVHPEVLKNGGLDPEEYSGFAWGFGLERLVMLKYGIPDIRYFTENNLKFLSQF
jgi:phenylalanyl-tRNA synthetase alpha chain